ncbi:hypothetical protein DID78_03480 [Candidatus Marinamargulisbacteria bacterium SCGC AG-343-D04]|nr:hypothetical protein DID78_03480 [Candidatus Marinamargulisbacteria bacterium SCGC AG-343-D04]
MLSIIALIGLVLFLNCSVGAIVANRIKNTSVVDMFWSLGPCLVSWVLYFMYGTHVVQLIFSCLISIWALRLGVFFLFTRILKGKRDVRYTKIEEKWSGNKSIKVFGHFYMQGSLQFLLCAVFIPLYLNKTFVIADIHKGAFILFLFSLLGEIFADSQLLRFKESGKKGVCREGLWGICRHPNYFFECLLWVSLAMACEGLIYEYVAWLSPLSIFIIMRFITGPYTEKVSLERRGESYMEYQREVPMFFPSVKLIIKKVFL